MRYNRVDELRKIIKKAEDEIGLIQKDCKHLETKDITYSWRIGSSVPGKQCIVCDEITETMFSNPDNYIIEECKIDDNEDK